MSTVHERDPVRVESFDGDALWRVWLGGSKGNVLDIRLMTALTDVFVRAREERDLAIVCLEGDGAHFSYGASVAEHLPDSVADMLSTFHGLFRAVAAAAVPVLAVVRGQCLGGGLELAAFCQRVFASPDARLGQPEIRLGVFAPFASLILPERIGRAAAEDLCLTGRVVMADEALRIGLVDEVAEDPAAAALAFAREHLLPHSAVALRSASRALRLGLHERLFRDLEAIEHLYLDELMRSDDANEGLRAFLDKRPPRWSNS